MSVLQLHGLEKHYQKHQVLNKIDLEIQPNEVFGLIGLNGSGKTSLLKCLLDLHDLSGGKITIFEQSHQQKNARANLVYLAEKFSPPDFMTGSEYLRWLLSGHHVLMSRAAYTLRIAELLSKVDLEVSALNKSVESYSKGMLQKLGIMGCLLTDKSLLIMDEPMSGLDPKARALFKDIVIEQKHAGKTLFLCTHILSDIEQLCDKIAILHKGSLVYLGSPADCCNHYQAQSLEGAFLKAIAG